MLTMEQIEAAMYQKMKKTDRLNEEKMEGLTMEGGQREQILQWFVETQAMVILTDGNFPPWFQGFISRQKAEDQLRDKDVGCFLIRLSEKAIGYILSYKGQDRCRHFVINQTKTGQFVVSGDSTTHNSLVELIEHFKITPIQPFGEYLTSYSTEMDAVEEDDEDELYDVVQNNPVVKSGVSVKALTSLWEQATNYPHNMTPVLPSKSNRKLTTSTSIDRNSLSQAMKIPPLPKKNAPLRNSLSAVLPGTNPPSEQHSITELRTSEPYSSQSWPTHNENDQSLTSNPYNPMPSIPQQPPAAPLITASCSYAVLDPKKMHPGAGQMAHTEQTELQPNPLYQASTVAYSGVKNQPEVEYDNRANPNDNVLMAENPYQDVPEERDFNTYEHVPESNTYEDIPVTVSNMYASLDEIQTQTPNTLGKKNHKWWKLRLENKK